MSKNKNDGKDDTAKLKDDIIRTKLKKRTKNEKSKEGRKQNPQKPGYEKKLGKQSIEITKF